MFETYVGDILQDLAEARYRGLRIDVTHSAMQELMKEGKDLHDVVKVLEEGLDAPRKRKKDTIEKWLKRGNKTFNAVIVRNFNEVRGDDCWVLIHFGKFTSRQ